MLGALPKGWAQAVPERPRPLSCRFPSCLIRARFSTSPRCSLLRDSGSSNPLRLRLPVLSSGEEQNSGVLHRPPRPQTRIPIRIQLTEGWPPSSSAGLFPVPFSLIAPGPLPRSEHHRPLGLSGSSPLNPAPRACRRRGPKTAPFLSQLRASTSSVHHCAPNVPTDGPPRSSLGLSLLTEP